MDTDAEREMDIGVVDRPASRLLLLDADSRLLLFRFAHEEGALAGNVYWAPPGGGLEAGETYEAAACRELLEETGIVISHPGPEVARRLVSFVMPDGVRVRSDERYFLIRVPEPELSTAGWSAMERRTLVAHRWWAQAELVQLREQVWPQDMEKMLTEVGAWTTPGPARG